jgi:serine/threonine-protein kinase
LRYHDRRVNEPNKTISPVAEAVEATALRSLSETVAVPELLDLPRIALDEGDGAAGNPDVSISKVLGVGGMGRVELGQQRVLRREVAVKRIRPDRYSAVAVSALLRESRLTGALEHPNIVPVHQLGVDGAGRPILLMKRVDGASWSELLEDSQHKAWGPAPVDTLSRNLEILRQVCNAVHFAHQRGVLHRDLKTANVMVGEFGEVYVVDWGVAMELRGERSADLAGTPAYMAPEMAAPGAPLDARTDVYLLGTMLHEALTGRVRHEGADLAEVLEKARRSEPFSYGPDVPPELGALCNRACAKEPGGRPSSALDFSQALADYVRHRGSLELAERVERRRLELDLSVRDGAPAERVRTLIAETSFGFRQALDASPGNALATAGLQRSGETAIAFELAQRNPAGAEAVLLALPQPRPRLADQIRLLRAEVDAQANAQRELASLRHDVDPRVGERIRSMISAFMLFGMMSVAIALRRAGLGLSYPVLVSLFVGFATLHAAVLAVTRDRWLGSPASRERVATAFVLYAGGLVIAGVAWRLDATIQMALVQIDVQFAFCLFVAALSYPRIATTGVAFLGAGLLMLASSEPMMGLIFGTALAGAMQTLRSFWARKGEA